MPKRYSSKQVITVLQKLNFQIVGQKGSHIKLRNSEGKANQKIVFQGTFLEILKQVGISRKDFEELL